MFRPVPTAIFWRKVPYRPIAVVILILALVVSVILLFSLEREKLLLQGLTQGGTVPTELLPALWQARRDVILVTVLVFLVSAIAIAGVIILLDYDSTRRTLEEVKGLARNILESIPTGVLTINRSGQVTVVNPSAAATLKRSTEELLGKSYEQMFPPGDMIRMVLDGALHHDHHVEHHDMPYRAGDHTRTIRLTTADLTGDEGSPVGVIVLLKDVTELLGLERRVWIADKLAAMHTLSAGVAHELRNPLSAIDLNLHLLEEDLKEKGLLATQGARYLHVLNAECRRLSVILDNFMKFARPGSVSLHEVDVKALIDHILALMHFEAEERKIRLEQVVEEELPPVVGDETHISQMLVNIIVNSFHAMPNGGLCQVTVAQREIDGKAWVEITVKDDGVGITKEEISHLFEPFYTTKSSGTGLGLAIAYRIMQDHGGTIQVSSVPGSGTTVVTQFPVAIDQLRKVGMES
jgi:PAS domain S-box-containing protein